MKNEKKTKNLITFKKVIAVAGGLLCLVGVGTFIAVQARRNTLNTIQDYSTKNTFNILEIVPTNVNHANEEIGYFVSEDGITASGQGKADFKDVSKAKSLGGRTNADSQEELQNFIDMRDYGLIKFEGIDRGSYNVDVSEHPVYSKDANFVKNALEGYAPMGNQFILGTYKLSSDNSGAYFLKDGYTIKEDGRIYRVVKTIVEQPAVAPEEPPVINDNTVSDNTVSDNTVSDNEIETDDNKEDNQPDEPTYEITYEPVEIGNRNDKKLPEGIEQRFDADGKLLLTGDVEFGEDVNGYYYGLTENAYYYYKTPSINNDFHNGDWFKEYVLGDRTLKTNIKIDTIAANQITKASLVDDKGQPKYDLIYVSGSYEAYQNANVDLSEEAVMELFNITAIPVNKTVPSTTGAKQKYQAVIMDYALLGPASSTNPTNLEKLALLLWQEEQTEIFSMSTEGLAAQDTFTLNQNGEITAMPVATSNTWSTLGATMNNMPGISNGTFVTGSVYVYNHMRSYFTTSKVQIDAKDFFANGDFASTYTDALVSTGFTAVKAAAQMNNINFSNKRVSEAVTPALVIQYILSYDGTTPRMTKSELHVLEIQPVKAFLYNQYWGTTSYDDCTNDIKKNRDEFAKKYFDDSFAKNPQAITFTSMTIEEFIGRNEDLNETYDIIYIGTNTYYNKDNSYYYMENGSSMTYEVSGGKVENGQVSPIKITAKQENDVKISAFNDISMYGMLYYNIGDVFDIGTRKDDENSKDKDESQDSLLGIIDDGSVYKAYSEVNNPEHKFISHSRFSGRDLTTDKKEKLIDFLKCGYPVIVAGDIMRSVSSGNAYIKKINPTEVTDLKSNIRDHGRVDNSSELYEFLNYAVNGIKTKDENGKDIVNGGNMDNLISEADVEIGLVTKEELATYFNEPKLSLNITNQPVAYSYSTTDVEVQERKDGVITPAGTEAVIDEQAKLAKDPVTGKYYLDYEFTITNAATVKAGNDTYGVHLYIDVNADGKFSETEELADCTVTNAVSGTEIAYTNTLVGRVYSLNTGVLYKLRREVPEGYSGVLPWCLEVSMDSNSSIRASQIGYTQVPRPDEEKIHINILQVTKNEGTTLDLQNELREENIKIKGNYFGLYLSQLKDYEVVVTTKKQTEFENEFNQEGNYENNTYLDPYDMLILGFADDYDAFQSENAVNGIIKYMDSGKPVLLTHDLLMFRAGAMQTKMLRNVVGMDRYGVYDYSVTSAAGKPVLRQEVKYTIDADAEILQKIQQAGHRVVYLPGSNKTSTDFQTHGITNLTMVRYRYNWRDYNGSKEKRYINWDTVNRLGKAGFDEQTRYEVFNINEGQITTYPYILPENFTVATTHNQYYQLDMEADMDQDGESDIVVWYTLGQQAGKTKGYTGGGDEYNMTPNDVVNNYYIYNRGNITYSGVGHSKPAELADDKYEAQLFVNTMIAAYRAGVRAPSVKFFESAAEDSKQIESLAVAYDKNVGKNAEQGESESSILKYEDGTYKNEFVNDGLQATKVYFQINDPNFVKGDKKITASFYLEDSAGAKEITLADKTVIKVSEMPLKIYNADFSQEVAANSLKSGVRYGIYLPLSYLKTQGELKLYIGAQTTIENVSVTNNKQTKESPKVYDDFTVVKMDLLNLD